MTVVYVVTRGCYEDTYVAGVYDSLERAIAACPGEHWRRVVWVPYQGPYQSFVKMAEANTEGKTEVTTTNDLDSADYCEIAPTLVQSSGPLRQLDGILWQKLKSSGGWDYLTKELADILARMRMT